MEDVQPENIVLDVIDLHNENVVIPTKNVISNHENIVPIIKSYVTSQEYNANNLCLKTMKLPEIRETLKFYKNSMVIPLNANTAEKRQWKQAIKSIHDFTLIGAKPVILERLRLFYQQDIAACIIQKRVRGFFVKYANYLRGPASIDRSKCVNATDFYTMDPMNEIPYIDFFSYMDKDNFIYGFDIHSLIEYAKSSRRRIKNPYTRTIMDVELQNMKKLCRLNNIITTIYVPPVREVIKPIKRQRVVRNNQSSSRRRVPVNPHIPADYNSEAIIGLIRERRAKPINERLRLIFMDIDQLGNYTQMSWLSNLQLRDYTRFFRILKDIWNYRAQLSHIIKVRICPLWDPFMILSQNGIQLAALDREQWFALTISIMEDMICTGVDIEHKTLGAFHILSALTIVSHPARVAMPWLYESLVW
jgi:hypothetical protein